MHKTLKIQAYQSFGTDLTVCTQQQESSTSSTSSCESSTDVNPTTVTAQNPLASDGACSTDDEESSSSHINQNSDPCTQSSVDIMIVSVALIDAVCV